MEKGSRKKPNRIGENNLPGIHSKTSSTAGLSISKIDEARVEIKIENMLNAEAYLLLLNGGISPFKAKDINGGRRTESRRVCGSSILF